MKTFNTEGQCIPGMHYMVNIDKRLEKINRMIFDRKYLYIQEGRQYGKTTMLMALGEYIKNEYIVLMLDFQAISSTKFENEHLFSKALVENLEDIIYEQPQYVDGLDMDTMQELREQCRQEDFGLVELFRGLKYLCRKSARPIVLMVDEVDSAANNQVFLDFLSQLRLGYINREKMKTFQSVILAGVYDIKNLKLKIRPTEEHDRYNSPWNIAARFPVEMDFSAEDIAGMLREYEADHHTGMDVANTAQIIYDFTSGYPYLVSAVCKSMDEEIPSYERFKGVSCVWNEAGVGEAVKALLKEDIPLFGSLTRQMEKFSELKTIIHDVLFKGKPIPFSAQVEPVNIGVMFGYLKEKDNLVAISNRIFEMLLQNMFITEAASNSEAYQAGLRDKSQFIQNGRLDMDHVMNKFVQFYGDVFADRDEKYVENFGREIFLMYLKPIINGVGNSYQESTTRTMTRTDIIVDYLGEQFIIELKIWHGQEDNSRGEAQLCEYLDYYHKQKGYLLSFNFNKNKTTGVKEIHIGDKTIVEAVV